MNYTAFQRPSRYINSELYSIRKDAQVSIALAFPDLYEVGMSHLGFKVLYHLINEIPYASAERVYAPWTDLEAEMRRKEIALASLESRRPLNKFDIVGFSLQYELSYTTVLNMLDLGRMPLKTEDRLEGDFPLVIAGGPCTLNPLPMSPFIDAFLIGDGEEAVPEMLEVVYQWKQAGRKDRQGLLYGLSKVEGVFVPMLSGKDQAKVRRRFVSSLDDAPWPDRPIVPFANIVHDRISIEIARGCSRGCRFCQAGMAYRPVRERSLRKVIDLAERSLKNTGLDSISFTSLSAGDYSALPELLAECNRRFAPKRISMSLPSLRVGSVTEEILDEIREVRKTGFTIAPEAGTDRLRAVINKDFTEETYQKALETLFKAGWLNLKLYFMTGLPTETEADIEAVVDMVGRTRRLAKKITGRHVTISAGVSSFIPKPHTPFQWYGQRPLSELKEKNSFLRRSLIRLGAKFKGHDEQMSLLEAACSRGDGKVSALIEEAWRQGCRLDAWTESFDFGRWLNAMDRSGIDAAAAAERSLDPDLPLPWEMIDTGVTKEFLRREHERAVSVSFSPDCRMQCLSCGLKCGPPQPAEAAPPIEPGLALKPGEKLSFGPSEQQGEIVRARMEYSKSGSARFLSHLEVTTALVRAMRRAEFPFRYSSGFHPAPRLSFGPALAVGIAGLREYLDIELIGPFDIDLGLSSLSATLPEGIGARRMARISAQEKSLNSFIIRYVYEVSTDLPLDEGFIGKTEVISHREAGPVNIREMVEEAARTGAGLWSITLIDRGEVKVRLDEILSALFGVSARELTVTRTAMYGKEAGWRQPLS